MTQPAKCLLLHPAGRFCGEPAGHFPATPHRVDPELGQCAALGCEQPIPRLLLMCPPHWALVPRDLQARVTRASVESATEWVAAVADAVAAVQAVAS